MPRHPLAVCFAFAVACVLCTSGSALAVDAVPQTLTLQDLANHPERWPAQVTIKKPMRFGGGMTLQAGQSVRLVELQGSDVVIDAGRNNLVAVGPDECDLVAAANKMWSALTPAQRAVDAAALANDASLWPDKVKSLVAFDLTTGQSIPPGRELTLINVDPSASLVLYSENPEARVTARLADTDLIARARDRAAIDPAERKSRVVEALHGNLIDSAGKAYDARELDGAKVIVLYHGASWCQPCHQFSPTLVKFVNSAAAKNPHLFVAMISADDKDADLLKYATDARMPWPLLPKSTAAQQPYIKGLFGNYIPQVVVLDHFGKLLATADANGHIDNAAAMRELARVVNAGAAR